jgi:antibiotic biosynthesis monooxygenase (ABM) superfamily enzyme
MKLGDLISFEKDGIIHTERVESFRYEDGTPAVYRNLNRWQSFARRLTPPRWRRSLLVRPATLPTVTINGTHDYVGKTIAQLEQMKATVDKLCASGE